MSALVEKVYCAFCRLERNVYRKKSVTWTNVVLALLASTLGSFLIWRTIEPRMMLMFAVFVIIAEVFLRIRWRVSLPCPHCGFDPVLYKSDREETVRQVNAKLSEVRASGRYLLKKNNPLQNLPARPRETQTDKTGQFVSRQV